MQRVMKATVAAASAVGGVASGSGRAIKIETLVAAAVHKLLPDFQLFLNIRSKYVPLYFIVRRLFSFLFFPLTTECEYLFCDVLGTPKQ